MMVLDLNSYLENWNTKKEFKLPREDLKSFNDFS